MKRFSQCRRGILPRCAHQARRPLQRNAARCRVYILGLVLFPCILFAGYRFPIGEQATYKIYWGLVSCGTTTIRCDEVVERGQNLIRIRVRAKSNWLVSTVYPVDDTVDCFIDPDTQLSVRMEKSTSEGDFICRDVLEFDRANNTAQWDSQSLNLSTNYAVEAGTCDAVSFLYAFRQYDFAEDQARDFNLAVDTALHGVTITAKETGDKAIGETGKARCRKFIATPKRDDLFVRKIPEEIWITADARKIMAKMVVKIPVGKVRIVLAEYQPPPGF
ncbi:MAG: DUF3108 domain-containing protein [Kiritimatiellales bacterium]|nr:DUF3108 domain-containing protein [Kiritimatiellales bacterium]MCF7863409.1 DUF3108 domain-containing protein [Kiritimatiellales bacterium]